MTDSPVPTTGQNQSPALIGPERRPRSRAGRYQSFLAARSVPGPLGLARSPHGQSPACPGRARLAKRPVIMILILLLLAPAVLGATRDMMRTIARDLAPRPGQDKARTDPRRKWTRDESRPAPAPAGGQHAFKGEGQVTGSRSSGKARVQARAHVQTCSSARRHHVRVQMIGPAEVPGWRGLLAPL